MKIRYTSNDGKFTMESIRKGEILDRIVITQTKKLPSPMVANESQTLDMSELGFAMMVVKLAEADPKFLEMVRKIYTESESFEHESSFQAMKREEGWPDREQEQERP